MLALLTAAAFVIFAQIFLVAPILPALAREFDSTSAVVGLAVPAFLVPYGVMVLVWGPLSDRWGRRPVILCSLAVFTILTAATPLVGNAPGFIGVRLATGVGASGVVPIGLALIGDLVPYRRRGRALGWMFGGMAGGMAFGAAGGALGQPVLGWHGLFGVVAIAGLVLVGLGLWLVPSTARALSPPPAREVVAGFADLLRTARGRQTYGYVLLNAVLHSGIYTWFGVYLHQHFGLGEAQIGLVLLGYGIPGLLLGPAIGHLADHYGRARIIPLGLIITAACAAVLVTEPRLLLAQAAIVALSLGYDMTQPPLAGIVTDLPGHRGQAIGLNACTLFVGMGTGSLVFQVFLLAGGFPAAFAAFALLALCATTAAVPLFRAERPHHGARIGPSAPE
ncbi:Inner membrane transport protein YdhC [Mycobacterium simulans]|uniref:Inner membrane transport protein YdhC n=1 Tax=Mycobacterium simulans TaxID=627089 RepID=A0A7Z7IG60_9MYCO|nr:MFS transporter [Mycobacterium simulans]SOJ52762.1 Inner membrane transport protein YdhC [Mycobacterium simulans]